MTSTGSRASFDARIDALVDEMSQALTGFQAADGHWAFELEADATIPAEYILLNHYLDEVNDETEAKLANYLRSIQGGHGGWPLYHDGDFNISASVKAYYALKLCGDSPEAPHMKRAREAILANGGAARANVLTRFTLALFGQVPWRATPVMWLEVMLLPSWFIFHLDKVSYWSRTVMVPLMVLEALKPQAKNPRGISVAELFVTPPDDEKRYLTNPTGHWLGEVMLVLDRMGRVVQPLSPRFLQRRAINRAMTFVQQRLNGEDGLGGIFPAIANTLMAFDALGYSKDHPDYVAARKAVDGLLVFRNGVGYCQPCLSPVWDTGLAAHALLETGLRSEHPAIEKANEWLVDRQILDVAGDWIADRPHLRPGGWAFQYRNDYYPDVDDTAVVAMALHRADPERYRTAIERAAEWIIGMQSRNGGWGAFNADNTYYFLQHIPFADHGALLDPPSADVSARCICLLAQLGYDRTHPALARGLRYLRNEQQEDGSWFGRWGNNYVYGTWSALCAFNAVGDDPNEPHVRRAVEWLKARQRADGGWGEDCASYWQHRRDEVKASTPSQTSWAVLGLMAAGEVDSDAVRHGLEYLLEAPRTNGKWDEEYFNAVGFPRVFYLRYHGYSAYFPLWTLARYRNLRQSNVRSTQHGF
ncbi:MAG: squalene--hopene cyclase [Rhodospirillales bacterium]|jgi:squalene-hopene/tetraprenyl-beta-curcumene cyclase|nr:squalene--hopene cyclase [Rhodospirillales bacterium]